MRLIDADELKTKVEAMVVHRVNESDYDFGRNQAFDYVADILIDDAPTIDAVEVGRCKDCKYRYMDGEITHYYWCRLHDRPVDDTDYCAWGEESEVKE